MTSVQAVNVDDITKITAGIILGLLVIGGLLALVISAVIGRLIVLIVVVGLGIALWLQRNQVTDEISKNKCNFNATYFGFHLDPSQAIKDFCAHKASGVTR
jgi:hypothetical protein